MGGQRQACPSVRPPSTTGANRAPPPRHVARGVVAGRDFAPGRGCQFNHPAPPTPGRPPPPCHVARGVVAVRAFAPGRGCQFNHPAPPTPGRPPPPCHVARGVVAVRAFAPGRGCQFNHPAPPTPGRLHHRATLQGVSSRSAPSRQAAAASSTTRRHRHRAGPHHRATLQGVSSRAVTSRQAAAASSTTQHHRRRAGPHHRATLQGVSSRSAHSRQAPAARSEPLRLPGLNSGPATRVPPARADRRRPHWCPHASLGIGVRQPGSSGCMALLRAPPPRQQTAARARGRGGKKPDPTLVVTGSTCKGGPVR
jgi:hypothetical protein